MARLSNLQFFNVCKWLEKNKEQILAHRLPYREVAKRVSTQLKITVSSNQVAQAAEAVGIRKQMAKNSTGANTGRTFAESDFATLVQQVEELFERTRCAHIPGFPELVQRTKIWAGETGNAG